MSKDRGAILVVGDIHIPFEHPKYLNFCQEIYSRVKCSQVILIGDVCDNHSISFHDHNPNGRSPIDEMKEADNHLKRWFSAFSSMPVHVCHANHDLVDRKARHVGLPDRLFKPFPEIWHFPKNWKYDFSFEIHGVRYQHGSGYSGDNAHMKAAYNNRQSTVIGHTHSFGGVGYLANEKDCIFGMNVGCGINRHTYAFEYGRDFKKKPIIGCGVVTDYGKYAQFLPMEM